MKTILDILNFASRSTSKQDGTIFISQNEYWSNIVYSNNDIYFTYDNEVEIVHSHQIIQMIEDEVLFK